MTSEVDTPVIYRAPCLNYRWNTMPEENTVDFAALCEELSARVESLEAQLAEE